MQLLFLQQYLGNLSLSEGAPVQLLSQELLL